MVPATVRGVPVPDVGVILKLEPGGQAVGSGLGRIDLAYPGACFAPGGVERHGMDLEITVVVGQGDGIPVGGLDSILDAVSVGVCRGMVPPVQVGVDLCRDDVGGLQNDFKFFGGNRYLVREEVGGGVVRVDAVYLEDGVDGTIADEVRPDGPHGTQVDPRALVLVVHDEALVKIIGRSFRVAQDGEPVGERGQARGNLSLDPGTGQVLSHGGRVGRLLYHRGINADGQVGQNLGIAFARDQGGAQVGFHDVVLAHLLFVPLGPSDEKPVAGATGPDGALENLEMAARLVEGEVRGG